MAELYFYKYNNAYNKIVRKKDTFADYQQYQIGSALQNINFNPNDGITAEHIINWNNDIPDYMIVGDGGEIISRWFVMEAQRTRGGQLRLSLLRDVLADNYDAVLNSKCFVQKGYVPNTSPLIFNNENMGFNQIKRGETLLKNKLETPWLVLYLARYKNDGSYNSFTGNFYEQPTTSQADYDLDSIEEYKYYFWTQHMPFYIPTNSLRFGVPFYKRAPVVGGGTIITKFYYELSASGTRVSTEPWPPGYDYPMWESYSHDITNPNELFSELVEIYNNAFSLSNGIQVNSYSSSYVCDDNSYYDLLNENGKTISAGGKMYRINVSVITNSQISIDFNVDVNSSLGLGMQQIYVETNMRTEEREMDDFILTYHNLGELGDLTRLDINLVEIAAESTQYTYDITYTKGITADTPYEIIASPLYNITFTDGEEQINHRGDIAIQWFQDVINKYNAAGFAYDLQIVPYCPIDVSNITTFEKTYLTRSEVKTSVAIMLPEASFTKQYPIILEFDSDYKISNETEVFRFVSPNGVGDYEFSPAKNGGITAFEVDCTLIPFNPYIKINPVFGNLYGGDYNDYRGLICGGDFSLPILNNSWETYQLNNKYYQDIFNRKIETQEYNNKWQLASNIAGAVSGAAGGAAMGGMIGGPIGAVAGGLLSAAGGITDVIAGQAMFREGIDYQKDMFGYELGTIKARAESLTRTTAYNINNKYFPYVEYYSCTDKERQALQDKIKYNGMTVGVIGTLSEYLNPSETSFFQGQLIEIDITDDAHTAHEIARELQEGRRFEH